MPFLCGYVTMCLTLKMMKMKNFILTLMCLTCLVFGADAQDSRILLDKSVKEGFLSISFQINTNSKIDSVRWVYLKGKDGNKVVSLALNPDGNIALYSGGKPFLIKSKKKTNYFIKIGVDFDKRQVQASYGLDSTKLHSWSDAELTYDDAISSEASFIQTNGIVLNDLKISLPNKDKVQDDIWKELTPNEIDTYKSLIASLPEEQFEWEILLQQQLGPFYFPRYLRERIKPNNENYSGWEYVLDNPNLPRLLLIGDSISRSYTRATRELSKGLVNFHRAPANCGPTTSGLKNMDVWLGKKPWDIIVFNFGIHDSNRPIDGYSANLQKVIDKLKATGAKLIWVRTTPVFDKLTGLNKSERVNEIADSIMQVNNIKESDISTAIQNVPDFKTLYTDGTHFKEEGVAVLAKTVSATIKETLFKNKK